MTDEHTKDNPVMVCGCGKGYTSMFELAKCRADHAGDSGCVMLHYPCGGCGKIIKECNCGFVPEIIEVTSCIVYVQHPTNRPSNPYIPPHKREGFIKKPTNTSPKPKPKPKPEPQPPPSKSPARCTCKLHKPYCQHGRCMAYEQVDQCAHCKQHNRYFDKPKRFCYSCFTTNYDCCCYCRRCGNSVVFCTCDCQCATDGETTGCYPHLIRLSADISSRRRYPGALERTDLVCNTCRCVMVSRIETNQSTNTKYIVSGDVIGHGGVCATCMAEACD
jgi:hypothetical protein